MTEQSSKIRINSTEESEEVETASDTPNNAEPNWILGAIENRMSVFLNLFKKKDEDRDPRKVFIAPPTHEFVRI